LNILQCHHCSSYPTIGVIGSGIACRSLIETALSEGHQITAMVHDYDMKQFPSHHPNLRLIRGDVMSVSDVARVLEGADAVVVCLEIGLNTSSTGKVAPGNLEEEIMNKNPPSKWSTSDVLSWLSRYSFSAPLRAYFEKEKADGETLLMCDDLDALKDSGMTNKMQMLQMVAEIKKLKIQDKSITQDFSKQSSHKLTNEEKNSEKKKGSLFLK